MGWRFNREHQYTRMRPHEQKELETRIEKAAYCAGWGDRIKSEVFNTVFGGAVVSIIGKEEWEEEERTAWFNEQMARNSS